METQERKKIILVDVSEYVGRFGLKKVVRYLVRLENKGVKFKIYFFNDAVWEGSIDELESVKFDRIVNLAAVYTFLLKKNYLHESNESYEIEIISSEGILSERDFLAIFSRIISYRTKIRFVFLDKFTGLIDYLFKYLYPSDSFFELFINWYKLYDNLESTNNFYYLNRNSTLKEFIIEKDYIHKKFNDIIERGGKDNNFETDISDSEYMGENFDAESLEYIEDISDDDPYRIQSAESLEYIEDTIDDDPYKIQSKDKVDSGDHRDMWKMDEFDSKYKPEPINPFLSTIFPAEVKKDEVNIGFLYLYEKSFRNLVDQDKKAIKQGKSQNYNELTQQIADFLIKKGDSISIEVESPTFIIINERFDFRWELNYNKFQVDFKSPDNIGKGDILVSVKVKNLLVAQMVISVSTESHVRNYNNLHNDTSFFEQIFVSYARKDMAIIKNYTRRYKALGIKVFIDTDEIRSGQNWKQEIVKHLQKSDIFQLFWSNAARKSGYVRDEYELALDLIKAGKKKNNYIRPNYWEVPMPAIPEKLSHINFHKLEHIPFLVKSRNTIKVAMNRVLVGLNLKKDPEKGGDLIA